MSGGSGPASAGAFASYDRESSCWRTFQLSLFEDLAAASPTWPRSGTWDLGAACARPMSAPATSASGSSSLLPTPRPQTNGGGYAEPVRRPGLQGGDNLATKVALLPTPLSGEARHGSPNQHRSAGDTMLTGVVASHAEP